MEVLVELGEAGAEVQDSRDPGENAPDGFCGFRG